MVRDLMLFVLVSAALLVSSCAQRPPASHPYFGTWAVSSFRSAPISALSDDEAAAWVGKTLVLAPDAASFDGEPFPRPSYEESRVALDDMFSRWPTGPETLNLAGESTVVLRVSEDIRPARSLVLASDDRLLTYWDGIFFELVRV